PASGAGVRRSPGHRGRADALGPCGGRRGIRRAAGGPRRTVPDDGPPPHRPPPAPAGRPRPARRAAETAHPLARQSPAARPRIQPTSPILRRSIPFSAAITARLVAPGRIEAPPSVRNNDSGSRATPEETTTMDPGPAAAIAAPTARAGNTTA